MLNGLSLQFIVFAYWIYFVRVENIFDCYFVEKQAKIAFEKGLELEIIQFSVLLDESDEVSS